MTVTVSTELKLPATRAWELAQRPALLAHVLRPWVTMVPLAPLPDEIRAGDELTVRLRFLGIVPAWRHTLHVERLEPGLIASREWGGPVRAWNHRLTFAPSGEGACCYTDTVEVRAGLATPLVALFAHLIYRYRQMRWRRLAPLVA